MYKQKLRNFLLFFFFFLFYESALVFMRLSNSYNISNPHEMFHYCTRSHTSLTLTFRLFLLGSQRVGFSHGQHEYNIGFKRIIPQLFAQTKSVFIVPIGYDFYVEKMLFLVYYTSYKYFQNSQGFKIHILLNYS